MSDINRENLADEFDIENTEIEIETFREVLNKAKELEDPNNALTTVIEKAGRFLDMVERESVNGAMSARYMEVAAQLVNSIITASNSIATINST
jgi:3-methyladenine DNA glycosylase/8-oxoguanine DNA glycosylase